MSLRSDDGKVQLFHKFPFTSLVANGGGKAGEKHTYSVEMTFSSEDAVMKMAMEQVRVNLNRVSKGDKTHEPWPKNGEIIKVDEDGKRSLTWEEQTEVLVNHFDGASDTQLKTLMASLEAKLSAQKRGNKQIK